MTRLSADDLKKLSSGDIIYKFIEEFDGQRAVLGKYEYIGKLKNSFDSRDTYHIIANTNGPEFITTYNNRFTSKDKIWVVGQPYGDGFLDIQIDVIKERSNKLLEYIERLESKNEKRKSKNENV